MCIKMPGSFTVVFSAPTFFLEDLGFLCFLFVGKRSIVIGIVPLYDEYDGEK